MRRRLYPVFADLSKRRILVVGGGKVALRKVRGLLEAGASIRLVAPLVVPSLERLGGKGKISISSRKFRLRDIESAEFVFAATDDESLNERIAAEARGRGKWINSATSPAGSNFHLPARFSDGPITVAVSTGGASPALAAVLAGKIRKILGPNWPRLARILGKERKRLTCAATPGGLRRRLEDHADEMIADLERGQEEKVRDMLLRHYER